MSRKLTDAELAETDVFITVDPARWANLPHDVRRDIEAYRVATWTTKRGYVIRLPAYRFRELEERMAGAAVEVRRDPQA